MQQTTHGRSQGGRSSGAGLIDSVIVVAILLGGLVAISHPVTVLAMFLGILLGRTIAARSWRAAASQVVRHNVATTLGGPNPAQAERSRSAPE